MRLTPEEDDSSARRPYTLAEKQKFWADLDLLPELAQDGDEDNFHASDDDGCQEAAKSLEISRTDRRIDSRTQTSAKSKVSESRKRTSTPPKNYRRPPFQPSLGSPSRRARSDKSIVMEQSAEPTNLSSPTRTIVRSADAPRPSTASFAPPTPVSPPVSRRVQTDQPSSRPKKSKGKKGKQILVPENERNLFDGLHLFSIPNSDSNPVQTKQIQNAVARGASWSRSWSHPVTHVVIFSDLYIGRASREFEEGRLPEGIPIVKDSWLVECMKFKEVQDPQRARFLVHGMKSAFELGKADAGEENAELPPSQNPNQNLVATLSSKTNPPALAT
jgi:hypothetical protein